MTATLPAFLSPPPRPVGEQNPAQIGLNLYLSSVQPAQDKALLNGLSITHILNLTGANRSGMPRYPNAFPREFKYLHLCIPDEQSVQITAYFDQVFAFLEEGTQPGSATLVHCEAGISRSSSIVIAFLMKRAGLNLKAAYEHVLARKANIAPNKAFFAQLIDFDQALHGCKSIQLTQFLAQQLFDMLGGVSSGLTIEEISRVLLTTDNDTDRAMDRLLSNLK